MIWQDGDWTCVTSSNMLEIVTCGGKVQLGLNTLVERANLINAKHGECVRVRNPNAIGDPDGEAALWRHVFLERGAPIPLEVEVWR